MTNIIRDKLSTKEIKELSQKSVWNWFKDVVLDWTIIIIAFLFFYTWGNILSFLLLMLVTGNRQHALTVLGHEASHYTLSSNKKFNDFISDLTAFWPLGITTSGYRNVHIKHHSYTNTEKDPELAHRASRSPQWDLPISLPRIFKYCLEDLLGFSYKDYIIIVTFSKPNKKREYIPLTLFHMVFNGLFVLLGLWWIPMVWYACLITSFLMFFRMRTFLEHLGSDGTHRLYLNWIERQIIAPHNIWYHWEHHSYPTVPYYKLPKVREKLNKKLIISLRDLLQIYKNSKPIISGEVMIKKN